MSDLLAGIFFADDQVIGSIGRPKGRNPRFLDADFEYSIKSSSNSKIPNIKFQSSSSPYNDLTRMLEEFAANVPLKNVQAITTASLGPFDRGNSGFSNSGKIALGTRSTHWSDFNLHLKVSKAFQAMADSTPHIRCLVDAEAMVLGEHYLYRKDYRDRQAKPIHGSHLIGEDTVAYLLCDEGVGGAVLRNGRLIKGDAAIEIGHMPIHSIVDDFNYNSCGAHSYPCLEGAISLKAMRERWGISDNEVASLPGSSPHTKRIAFYLAQAAVQITLFYSPTVIIFGGRIMDNLHIIPRIRGYYEQLARNQRTEPDKIAKGRSALYPHYQDGYDPVQFLQSWTERDAGVLGCLCWSQLTMNSGEILNWR